MIEIDGRGSWGQGLKWHKLLVGHIGDFDVQDQLAGLRYVINRYHVDTERVGVMGSEYGGYLAIKMMTDSRGGGDIISSALLKSPVIDWTIHGSDTVNFIIDHTTLTF